ncbi:hypothetical protein ACFX2B_001708 [Malus domestica]
MMLCSKHQANHCDKSFIVAGKAEELLLPSRDDEKSCTNMCHNTREWHRDVIRKIKWLSEKGIST